MHARCDGDAAQTQTSLATSCRPKRKQSPKGIVKFSRDFAGRERGVVRHDEKKTRKHLQAKKATWEAVGEASFVVLHVLACVHS